MAIIKEKLLSCCSLVPSLQDPLHVLTRRYPWGIQRLVFTYCNHQRGWGEVFCQRLDLDSGKKIGVWTFCGGVFCQRSDLDSGKKIGVWKFGGDVLPNVRFGLREENRSLDILVGGVLPKVKFGLKEENWSLEIWGGGGVLYQISE